MTVEDSRGVLPDEDDEDLSSLHTDEYDERELSKSNSIDSTGAVQSRAALVTTASVGIEKLVGLLTAKEAELRVLQKTHDEYVKSSCDYEKELESEVERYEKKAHAMESHVQSLEETKKHLQATLTQTQQELTAVAKREAAWNVQLQEMKWKIQRLEQTNDELETTNRVSQASIEELQHRIDTLTEENVFLVQEKEDNTAEKDPGERPGRLQALTRRVSDAAGAEPANRRASDKKRSGRYPEVVESCLHMTCHTGHCRHAQTNKTLDKTDTTKKKTGLWERLRQRYSHA